MRVIEIAADEIVPCLSGARVFDRGIVDEPTECEIRCDWAQICRVRITHSGAHEVIAVACAHPKHGVSPEHRAIYEQLAPYTKQGEQCPLCDGGWLAPDADGARQQVVMGHAIGVYRGIRIPRMEQTERVKQDEN